MKAGAAALSDAVAKKNPDAFKTAVKKLNTACSDCHNKFKKN
jgi:cytochrome c556